MIVLVSSTRKFLEDYKVHFVLRARAFSLSLKKKYLITYTNKTLSGKLFL